MSKFEELFPKPDRNKEGWIAYNSWLNKREGWLAFGRWVLENSSCIACDAVHKIKREAASSIPTLPA